MTIKSALINSLPMKRSTHENLDSSSPQAWAETVDADSVWTDPAEGLRREFAAIRSRNPHYSLRSFARRLGLASGRLSQYMNGKRAITPAVAAVIAERLALPPPDQRAMLIAAANRRSLAAKRRRSGNSVSSWTAATPPVQRQSIDEDAFAVMSDWYHLAMLNLIGTEDFEARPAWIAKRLGISIVEVRLALGRMQRLGLVVAEKGRIARLAKPLQTSDGIASAALRRSHRQSLKKALAALDELPVDQRLFYSMTIAADPEMLPAVGAAIRDALERVSALTASGRRREVYEFNLQFLPVSKAILPAIQKKQKNTPEVKNETGSCRLDDHHTGIVGLLPGE